MLDEALLRPGRLEVQVEIGLPDEQGRVQILQVRTCMGAHACACMFGWRLVHACLAGGSPSEDFRSPLARAALPALPPDGNSSPAL